jgi:hypothetical protein
MQVMRERRRLDIKRTIISDHVPAQRGVKRVRF